jgi:aspartyl protease family protein
MRWLVALLLTALAGSVAAVDLEVQGLFSNAAMLKIDGQSRLLKAGQSFGGVTLLASDSKSALVQIDGEERRVTMSTRVTTRYVAAPVREVRIPRNSRLQYVTSAQINGRQVEVMVDTGANIVALSKAHAARLGLDYEQGERGRVRTANGEADAWRVSLDSVEVGGIRVNNVAASVIEGEGSELVLLGMSYLQHVKLEESEGVLTLSRKY